MAGTNFENFFVVPFDRVNRRTGLTNYFTAIDVHNRRDFIGKQGFSSRFLTVRQSCGSLFAVRFNVLSLFDDNLRMHENEYTHVRYISIKFARVQ